MSAAAQSRWHGRQAVVVVLERSLPIGEYQLTAEAPGFKKTVRSGVKLGVSEVLRIDVQPSAVA